MVLRGYGTRHCSSIEPMPIIDIRRHSLTKKGASRGRGSHLSHAGVDLARAIGTYSEDYDISHGRIIEAGLVAAIPQGNFAGWGPPFQHGEGVRLAYANGGFSVVQFLRVKTSGDETQTIAYSDST
jgi:hypothetical protein